MRATLCCVLFLLCPVLTADDEDKKAGEKIDAKKLVGKWEPKDDKPSGLAVVLEFGKDGRATLTAGEGGKEERAEGAYRLDGNRLTVAMAVGGKEQTQTLTISRLTDAELVGANEKGKERTFVRVRDKGKGKDK